MIIKAILIGEVTARRQATIILPNGVDAADLVAALNTGEATCTNTAVLHPDKFATRVTEHEIVSQHLVWSVDSVLPPEDELEAPEAGCCSGGCCSSLTTEERLLQKVAQLNDWAFEFVSSKDIATTRRLVAAASALYELAGGGTHDEGLWLLSQKSFLCTLQGNHRAADRYGAKAIKMAKDLYGDAHPSYAVVVNNCAEGFIDAGNFEKAEKYLTIGLGILSTAIAGEDGAARWGSAHADALSNYRRLLEATGRREEVAASIK